MVYDSNRTMSPPYAPRGTWELERKVVEGKEKYCIH